MTLVMSAATHTNQHLRLSLARVRYETGGEHLDYRHIRPTTEYKCNIARRLSQEYHAHHSR